MRTEAILWASVSGRMRTEAIWWARAGAYKRADVGGAYGVVVSGVATGRERYGVPVFIFVNKLDLAGADRAERMDELRRFDIVKFT